MISRGLEVKVAVFVKSILSEITIFKVTVLVWSSKINLVTLDPTTVFRSSNRIPGDAQLSDPCFLKMLSALGVLFLLRIQQRGTRLRQSMINRERLIKIHDVIQSADRVRRHYEAK